MTTKIDTAMILGFQSLSAATRTALKAIPLTAAGVKAFLYEANRNGDFVARSGSIPFTDSNECVYITSNTAGFYWERLDAFSVNLLWCGVDPVYTTSVDNFSAFINAVQFCGITGRPLYIPKGRYGFVTAPQIIMDAFKTTGLIIYGDGRNQSILDLRSVVTSPNLQVRGITVPKDNFYFQMSKVGIVGNIPGYVVQMGEDDFSDPINMPVFDDVSIQNFDTSTSSRGIKLNYVLGGRFNWQVNCGSGGYLGGNGIAVVLRQSTMNKFFGSMGSSEVAMQLQDGFNIGNVIICPDFENVKVCVRILSGTANANTFEGGQWSFSTAGIDCQVGSKTLLLNPNVANNPPASYANMVAASVGLTVFPAL